jgi:hypothetical protein
MRFLLSVLLVIAACSLTASAMALPDQQKLSRLETGEVTVETIRADESGGAARFQIYMKATIDDIRSVINSCENAYLFLNGLKVCEVLEQEGNRTLTRQVVKTSWLIPRQDFTFRTLRVSDRRSEFQRTAGSPRVMEGSWEFTELSGGIVATHELRIKPSLPVPRFIVRHLMQKSMPKMLTCMRALAGGSLSKTQQAADFASCPKPPPP